MDLKAELRKLVALQEIDTRVYALIQQKDVEKPAEKEKFTRQLDEERTKLEVFTDVLKKLQLARKEKELDLASKEENVRKAQGQLYQLKTNKEYGAKLLEINSHKADVSKIEEEILVLLEQLDDAEKELNSARSALGEKEKQFKEKENSINNELASIQDELAQLNEKRTRMRAEVDSGLLARYEQLLATRGGLAVVSIDGENCGACHMRVTAQQINEAKKYNDIIFCENCVRMLYVKDAD